MHRKVENNEKLSIASQCSEQRARGGGTAGAEIESWWEPRAIKGSLSVSSLVPGQIIAYVVIRLRG